LECYSFEEQSKIYWLIDNQAPIEAESGKAIYRYLTEGSHDISCIDEGAKVRRVRIFREEV